MTFRPERDLGATGKGGSHHDEGLADVPGAAVTGDHSESENLSTDVPDAITLIPGDDQGGSTPLESDGEIVDGEILADVAAIASQRDEYLTALQLLQADFENYRKRVLRQQAEQSVRAAADLVVKLLPVLDTLDLAVEHLEKIGEVEGELLTEGRALQQSRSLLMDALVKEGLERVDSVGVSFDPSIHDAVAHAPAEEPQSAASHSVSQGAEEGDEKSQEGSGQAMIDDVLRAGYRWRGQVLRPAMVRVRG